MCVRRKESTSRTPGTQGDELVRAPYISATWEGLRWSSWMPLMAAHPLALAQLPSESGLYRVRRTDQAERLEWIGWAQHGVRETVERLSRQVHLPVRPYDDPRSPALRLWTLKREYSVSFDVSGAALPEDAGAGPDRARALRRACGLDAQVDDSRA